MKLDLSDLMPTEAELRLSTFPDKVFHLRPITLRVRAWMQKNLAKDATKRIFEDDHIDELSRLAYFILKEQDVFKTLEEFQDAVCSPKDIGALGGAVLLTMGISEPVKKQIEEAYEAQEQGNVPSPSQPTGESSTTESQASTDTPSPSS